MPLAMRGRDAATAALRRPEGENNWQRHGGYVRLEFECSQAWTALRPVKADRLRGGAGRPEGMQYGAGNDRVRNGRQERPACGGDDRIRDCRDDGRPA